MLSALRETAAGGSPVRRLRVRSEDGGERLLEFWTEGPEQGADIDAPGWSRPRRPYPSRPGGL
ncbi:hypothetical protein AB0N14_19680 [Streptomyces sp. NPDC051104]|uniref:hypothetical protein n=1 Tax=Streptomyces sp. NPDC051104 TaxID=3155044 RepID=UPI003413622E